MFNSIRKCTWMGCGCVLLMASGCATNRGILDVRVPDAGDPDSGPAVMIVRVTDNRSFELAPDSPSVPSLKGGEVDDESITSRAIARKRNGFGKALGDILLPEGRTVEDLVREALAKSLRQAGYRVVGPTPGRGGKPIPIEADIQKFWCWVTPGFWAMRMEFEAEVLIKGDVPSFRTGETVRGYIKLHTQAARTASWMNTVNKGIENFVTETTKCLMAGKE